MNNIKNIALVLIVCMSQIACQGFSPHPKRALTAKEKAVKVAKGDQETSLKLFNKCKEKNKLETFYNIDDARIRAVELGTNTAQIIYATSYNGSVAYDVKFWHCK
jgi:hypothetical protein